ncbi:MAG TPA: TspO/MBR family protein [Polyangia bacterium]|nr:TspO/MBR family protein [Polyangia bacterium]
MKLFKIRSRSLLWLGVFVGATIVAAKVGASASRRGPRSLWYRVLAKSKLQPPSWVFGPVWALLYGLMSASAYRVFASGPSQERRRALRLWWAQLALNGAWSPLFFGAHSARWALGDLAALTATVAAYTRTAAKVDRPAALMMAPYLGWLGFAGYLNANIVRRNPALA